MQEAHFQPIDEAEVYHNLVFPEAPYDRPYILLNMVCTVDGKATIAGKAGPIGGTLDHMLMRRIRSVVDALMYGAGTLRTDQVDPSLPPELQKLRVSRGLSPLPLAIVVSSSGQIPLGNLFFRVPNVTKLVIVPSDIAQQVRQDLEAHAQVVTPGPSPLEPRQFMGALRTEWGVKRLVVEGGPSLNHSLFAAGLADEIFLTLAPKIVGDSAAKTIVEGPPLPQEAMPLMELISVYRCQNELYLRYRCRYS